MVTFATSSFKINNRQSVFGLVKTVLYFHDQIEQGMNRIDRLMGMLTVLQSSRHVTAEKLSSRFGISIRTVYRDIRALDEIGIPVAFENGKGYFIMEGYFLRPVSLTSEEANSLVFLASLAERFGDGSVAKHASSALEKIRTVLRSGEKDRATHLADRIKVLDPNPPSGVFTYLSEMQKAIAASLIVVIDYTDLKKRRTRREIEPIGMVYYTEQWHVIAWCWLRNGYRDFIIKQIDHLQITSKSFRKTDHVSLDDHIRSWYDESSSPGLP